MNPAVTALAEAQAAKDRDLLAALAQRDGPVPVRVRRKRPHEGINLAIRPNMKRRKRCKR